MFQKARFKLTLWYLFIIMLISLSFSGVIYKVIANEVDRLSFMQKRRLERRLKEKEFFPLRQEGYAQGRFPFPITDPELVEETKRRVLLILFAVNGGIFLLAGGFGYLLAGKTLTPIKEMVDEQNRFISEASHQFRTPLTSLKSIMEVGLREKNLTLKEAKTIISESIEEADKLKLLTDELLRLSQYEHFKAQTKLTDVSLVLVIKQAEEKIKRQAKEKGITFRNKIVGDFKIKGQKDDLIDLFVILFDNAVKYSPRKSHVEVSAKKEGDLAVVLVKDYGVGIGEKDLPHIFDRFYRGEQSLLKEKIPGFGLGLSIAKRIVELHGGIIEVSSKVGKGTTFVVKLPKSKNSGGKE